MMWNTKESIKDMKNFADEQVRLALEAKKRQEEAAKPEAILEALLARCIEKGKLTDTEIKQYALMYRDLAPEDINGKISIRRMKSFLTKMEKDYPTDIARVKAYYDLESTLPENKMRKLNNSVQAFWSRCRTVENCYKYSHSFFHMAKRIAPKLEAPEDMGVIERCKWLRLWIYLIKDQGRFWTDVNENGYYDSKKMEAFDKTVYLNPEIMVVLEESNFFGVPDGAILLDMIKAFINLYPEDVQKAVLRFGELDGVNQVDDLRAGYVRQNLKKKLFPVMWVSGLSYFFTRPGIQTSRSDYMANAVKTYKNKTLEELPIFEKKASDPFDHYKIKTFNCYEISTEIADEFIDGEQVQYVFAVTNEKELQMYVEVYKWLLSHPDFKFGPDGEEKTLEEYGLLDLLEDAPTMEEMLSTWATDMGFASSEEDVNLDCIMNIIDKEVYEELLTSYMTGEIDGNEIYEKIGFSSELQAKICCSQTIKLVMTEATKMAAALKRVKTFGEKAAIRSDMIYLEIFKYYMSNKKEDLPKNTVKLYGKAF